MAEAYIAEQPQCNQQQSKNRSLPKNNNEIPDDEISAATLPPPSSSNDAANNHRRAKSMAYSVQDPALLKEMDGNLIDSNLEPHYLNWGRQNRPVSEVILYFPDRSCTRCDCVLVRCSLVVVVGFVVVSQSVRHSR